VDGATPVALRCGDSGAVLIVNGVLVAIPTTIDDQRYPLSDASRAIRRTAG
jgi:hypothetical protein